jgi:hypothetical protein
VGKGHSKCYDQKVHGRKMHQVDSTKYLGDIIHKSAKGATNIAARRVKAVASFSVFRAILEDIPLGKYRTEIGLELRRALFLNSVLFNCETWHGLKETDITEIKLIDNQILRFICSSHAKTPLEFLFLETGAIPVSFIIASRRMNYLHEILTRDDKELVKRVFLAQEANSSQGDFFQLVSSDFVRFGSKLDKNSICSMTKTQHKLHIRKLAKAAAFKELSEIQAEHIKVNSILYKSLDTQEYLTSSQFSNNEAKLLFALRSHSIRGIKANFSSAHKEDIYCPLKCEATPLLDDQRHLLVCKSLCRNLSTSHLEALRTIKYEDIYGPIYRQKEAVNVFWSLLSIRDKLLEHLKTTPPAASGYTLVTALPASQESGGDRSFTSPIM